MQKIVIAKELIPLGIVSESLFNRTDIGIFTAATTDELLKIHVEEAVDLIVTTLDLPGKNIGVIFDIILRSRHLKEVHIIIICEDNVSQKEQCKQYGVHAILTTPVDPDLLQEKIREFLNISRRQTCRVILDVSVDGKFNGRPFPCHMENISATGALIRSQFDLSPGDRIACSFYLPNGIKVEAQAEVVRLFQREGSDETLYGIVFLKISAESMSIIVAYVDQENA